MAIAALDIPLDNSLRFVPIDGQIATDPSDNMKHFDADWFTNLIRDWQYKTDYAQPWQFNDRMSVYVKTNSQNGLSIKLVDCNGRIWKTWNDTGFVVTANDTIRVGNSGQVQAYVYYLQFKLSEIPNLPEGIYWLLLDVNYSLIPPATTDYVLKYVSEPISVAAKHNNTVHVDYSNSDNKGPVLYAITNARFRIRVAADVVDYGPASNDTQYEDGDYNVEILASQAYRTCKFALTKRVPDWVIDRLNHAFSCDTISIDSKAFTKEIGAKWEINRVARVPKVIAALPLREVHNDAGAVQIIAASFIIYTYPAFPYVVKRVAISDGVEEVILFNDLRIIHNTTEQTAFLNDVNANASAQNIAGTLTIASNTATWTNGPGDFYITGDATILTTPLTIQLTTANVAQSIGLFDANAVVDYGDGAYEEIISTGLSNSTAHGYGSTGTWNLNIFGTYKQIYFNDGYLANVGGVVPIGLTIFSLTNSFTITTFNAAVLTPASATLTRMDVFVCNNLTTVTNLTTLILPRIARFKFNNNKLNSAAASAIVIYADTNVPNVIGVIGSVNTLNQSPVAPMTAAGTAAKNDLINVWGWSVTTD